MANTDWAFGFAPYGNVLRANYYAIVTAPTINIMQNDIVGVEGVLRLTPAMGYLPGLYVGAVPDGLFNLVGCVLALFDENMDPTRYIAVAEAGNGVIAGYALVADHPNQEFVAREDFDTNAIDTTEGSNNADMISVALCAGDTTTGISRQMIDSDTAATTDALQLTLRGPHPNDVLLVADDTPGASSDEGARWICTIRQHLYGNTANAAGAMA